jgi:hypothetical protein
MKHWMWPIVAKSALVSYTMVGCQRRSLIPNIQPIDLAGRKLCHCGVKAKWTASLTFAGAQIRPPFQKEELCQQHAEQFAAVHKLETSAHLPAVVNTRALLSIALGS